MRGFKFLPCGPPQYFIGWSPASSSEAGRAYLEEGGYRGEDASELRLGRMSSVLVGGCNPTVSGHDSKTLAPSMV